MDPNRIAAMTRSLTVVPSRRDVLHGLAAAGLGLAAHITWSGGETAVAAKKKKKKKQKNKKQPQPQPLPPPASPPPFNEYGCLDVGQPCQGDSSLCCSGVCDAGTSTCVAHNAGICYPDIDSCTLGLSFPCNPDNVNCFCTLTTGNAAFCGDISDDTKLCRFCSTDTDCQEELGPGAACVVLKGVCSQICPDTGRTACVAPCA